MESRYTNRFRSIGDVSGKAIRDRDAAGNLTERLAHARGSLAAQSENIQELFATAQEMIAGINTVQTMMGRNLVTNIPLPTEKVKSTQSAQLGYVQLAMRFLQSGLIHFMEETNNAQDRIAGFESFISELALADEDVDLIGRMLPLEISDLETADTGAPPTPPRSDTNSSGPQTASVTTPVSTTTPEMASGTGTKEKKPSSRTSIIRKK